MVVEFVYKTDAELFAEEIVKVSSMKPVIDSITDKPEPLTRRFEVCIQETDTTKAFAVGFAVAMNLRPRLSKKLDVFIRGFHKDES